MIESLEGYHITIISGGSGSIALTDALLDHTDNVNNICPVTDNWGDTRRLRDLYGSSAVGDLSRVLGVHIRNNEPGREMFWRRFEEDGSRIGNSIVAVAERIAGGNLYQGIRDIEHTYRADLRGHVFPVSNNPRLHLAIPFSDGTTLYGEEHLDRITSHTPEITGLYYVEEITPRIGDERRYVQVTPKVLPEAIDAGIRSDINIISPGSWHGSILASLEVPGMYQMLKSSKARMVIYVNACDFLGWKASRYLKYIFEKTGRMFDLAVVDTHPYTAPVSYSREGKLLVVADIEECKKYAKNVILAPVTEVVGIDENPTIRHNGPTSVQILRDNLTILKKIT